MTENKTVLPDLEENERKTVKAMQDVEAEGDDNLIRLSTGVVLEARQVPSGQLIKVMSRFQPPEPPMYFNKDLGRSLPNTADPYFETRMKEWEQNRVSALLNILIIYGVSLKSKPKGMPGPDDDEWLDSFYAAGEQVVADNKYWRLLNWVTAIAAPKDEDIKLITEKVGRLSGVREADVKDAANFPGSDQKR